MKAEKPKPIAIAAASTSVTISDFQFAPGGVTVNVGDTVTWTNTGPTPHSATASDGSFDTGIMDEGSSGSHTFTEAGTFAYICTPHPNMKGTVVGAGARPAAATDERRRTPATGTHRPTRRPTTARRCRRRGMDVGGAGRARPGRRSRWARYLRRRTAPEPARPAGRIGW